MTSPQNKLQQRNQHRSLLSRLDPNAANIPNGVVDPAKGSAGSNPPTDPPSSTPPAASSTPPAASSTPPASPAHSTTAPAQPSSPPAQKPTSTPKSTSSATTPSTSSSVSKSTSVSASSTAATTTAASVIQANVPVVNTTPTTQKLFTSSFAPVTPTNVDSAGSTITADPVESGTGATSSAGSIAGGVIGGLIALAVLAFIVAFFLRRFKRSRRHARRHESDFGTFNRSAFVAEKPSSDMTERRLHNITPSVTSLGGGAGMAGHGTHAAGVATPPSQIAAAAAAAAAAPVVPLQERPKYVYGQTPNPSGSASIPSSQDDASEYSGAYGSEPQPQTSYNAEAYGNYAQAGTGYQEAERGYQAQQGYDAQQQQQHAQGGYYDQAGYAVGGYEGQAQAGYYDHQQGQQQYDYSQQYDQYAQTGVVGGQEYAQQGQAAAYQPPHPYATTGMSAARTEAAYGGM